jgi:hypothetical protein
VTNPRGSSKLEWAITAVRGRLAPVALSDSELRWFAGRYGRHTVRLVHDHLEYQSGGTTCRMIPIGEDAFLLDGVYDERLRFSRDGTGQVTSVVRLTQAGPRDVHDKER